MPAPDESIERTLSEGLGALPGPLPALPPTAEILRRARQRRPAPRHTLAVAGLAAAAALTLAVLGPWPASVRDKGASAPIERAHLRAVAEGADGQVRRLRDGDAVQAGEWVIFQADAAPGLWLMEAGRPLPLGRAQLTGADIRAYRPDSAAAGSQTYTLAACPSGVTPPDARCAEDALVLVWR